VFGKADSSAIDLSVIADANNPTGGFVINGGAAHDYSGCSVSSAGDVNGDGLDDLIVGAYFTNSSAGKSYITSTHNQIIQTIAIDIACTGD
jgi:hypothetical protein